MKFPLLAISFLGAAETLTGSTEPSIDGVGATALGKWIIIFVAVLLGIKAVLDLYKDHFKEQPPVQKQIEGALAGLRVQVDALIKDKADAADVALLIKSAIQEHELAAKDAGSGSREKIYLRLTELEKALPRIEATLHGLGAQVSDYHAEVQLLRHKS